MERKNTTLTIFGGSGFIGSYVVQELAKTGAYIKVASRYPERSSFLKTAGNIGQIYLQVVDVNDPGSVKEAIRNSDIVIDMVGILFEKGKRTFQKINKDVAINIAAICKEQNIKQFIYFSALNVNHAHQSEYACSKYQAEQGIKKVFPNAIIVRPSVVFGADDNFFNFFAKFVSMFHFLPLIDDGHTKFQPVYVGDVAKAIAKIIKSGDLYQGGIFELAGKNIYSYKELMKFLLKTINKKAIMISIPSFIAHYMSFFMEFLPQPLLTRDQVKLLKYDNVIHKDDKLMYLSTLGIVPKALEQIVPLYLRCYKKA